MNTRIDIIGVPMDYGGNRRGVDMGPSAIRYSDLKNKLISMGLHYNDSGNILVPVPEKQITPQDDIKGRYRKEINRVNQLLYDQVLCAHKREMFPLILGGDHSLAVGSCMATLDVFQSIGVIWIDAHGDFNNSQSSQTGNVHGMPLSAISGRNKDFLEIASRDTQEYVDEKNIVIIAARDLDIAEVEMLRDSNVTVFSMQHIDKNGMHSTIKEAIRIASNNTNGFHVSFDLDAISPKEAPGVGTPVQGGLTFRESHLLMEMIWESKNMLSLDIVELNPIADNNNITGNLAVSLIQSALGKNIL